MGTLCVSTLCEHEHRKVRKLPRKMNISSSAGCCRTPKSTKITTKNEHQFLGRMLQNIPRKMNISSWAGCCRTPKSGLSMRQGLYEEELSWGPKAWILGSHMWPGVEQREPVGDGPKGEGGHTWRLCLQMAQRLLEGKDPWHFLDLQILLPNGLPPLTVQGCLFEGFFFILLVIIFDMV